MSEATVASLSLESPLIDFYDVNSRVAHRLQQQGIDRIDDLLLQIPICYQDMTRIVPLSALVIGSTVQVQGTITQVKKQYARRPMLLCKIQDKSASLNIRWFHFTANQQVRLQVGQIFRGFGEIRQGRQGLEMVHPQYRVFSPQSFVPVAEHYTPIYPKFEGVSASTLSQLIGKVLDHFYQQLLTIDWLPEAVQTRYQLSNLAEVLEILHRPSPVLSLQQLNERTHPIFKRLIFEELLAHHLGLKQARMNKRYSQAPAIVTRGSLSQRLQDELPFALTQGQQQVLKTIQQDLQNSQPMARLIQGDVGSGKTIVAILAALHAIEAGYQVALMAPTELLAEQHCRVIRNYLSDYDLKIAWLSSSLTKKQRNEQLQAIASHEAAFIIGTHALFQKDVIFHKLGLMIIDEQHRFGVAQRLQLQQKGTDGSPHQLILSATPIPRTLAMTFFADLDVSIIDMLPSGRLPIETILLSSQRKTVLIERIRSIVQKNQQVYWVCPLIEMSEQVAAQAVTQMFTTLKEQLLDCRIGYLHGKMTAVEKEAVMADYQAKKIDILVATTVIEVGIDVPNATLIVLENAERLGLSQLHQLRGRVGRGTQQSYCVLLYHPPISKTAQKRLSVMRDCNDGFEIAKEDLAIRGPGDLLGTEQTGLFRFRLADLSRDYRWLSSVRAAAHYIEQTHPTIIKPLISRWLPRGLDYSLV